MLQWLFLQNEIGSIVILQVVWLCIYLYTAGCLTKHPAKPVCSASFFAEKSARSPRKLFIFVIYKNIFWMKVSKKHFI